MFFHGNGNGTIFFVAVTDCMGMGQFKKRGNAKSPITTVITAVITAREYYREAPWEFSCFGKKVSVLMFKAPGMCYQISSSFSVIWDSGDAHLFHSSLNPEL